MPEFIFKYVTDKIIEQLEKGSVVWAQPWADNGPPRNLISNRPYQGVNALLLAAAGYASPFWSTERAITKLGGRIRAEEKSCNVFFWRMNWVQVAEKTGKNRNGNNRLNIFSKSFQLYNTEQCEGLDQKIPRFTKNQFNPIDQCETILKNMPFCPAIEENEPMAYYFPLFDYINMPSKALFMDPSKYYATLFHEIVHSTGHKKRLGRHNAMPTIFDSLNHDYSQEELVAEIGAGFLCAHAGILNHTIENTGAYIQPWLKCFKRKQRILFFAIAQAQKATNFVLGRLSHPEPSKKHINTYKKEN